MLDHGIQHVPVVTARSEVLGVVRDIDLLAAQTRTPFMLRRAIAEATEGEELGKIVDQLNLTVVSLRPRRSGDGQISAMISVVFDALIRRMIEIAVERSGAPPAEFAWFAFGSDGRREAVPSSDVDSGMSWEEGPEGPDADAAEYMHADRRPGRGLARVHGLAARSARASPPRESSPASSIVEWRRAIGNWLSHPEDEKVLIATSILLDGRTVFGADDLDPKALFLEASDRGTLLRWMLRLALAASPPTGFRRDFVVELAERRGKLDIKHGGLQPVVDIARYAALKGRLEITVHGRAPARRRAPDALKNDARTLEEAFHLFMELRLEHQVRQLSVEVPRRPPRSGELNWLTRR